MAGDMMMPWEQGAKAKQHQYDVEDAVRTLTKAEEIKANKQLYDEACAMMKKQKGHMDKAMGQPLANDVAQG